MKEIEFKAWDKRNKKWVEAGQGLLGYLTEQNEGRPCEPYFVNQKMDLCITCLEKITVIHAKGAQGYNKYWVKKEGNKDGN